MRIQRSTQSQRVDASSGRCIVESMAKREKATPKTKKLRTGAVAAEDLAEPFPPIRLPIQPPYPPMEAKSVEKIPDGDGWLYEPKWDGFRCLAFRREKQVLLQSKAGQPLGRYFPELVEALEKLPQKQFVLDGEIVIFSGGHLSFDDLLMRIHPAESRIRKLSKETPASLLAFDLLVDDRGKSLVGLPLRERQQKLETFFENVPKASAVRMSPA